MRTDDSQNGLKSSRVLLLCIGAGFAAILAFMIWILLVSRSMPPFEFTFVAMLLSTVASVICYIPIWHLLKRKKLEEFAVWLLVVPFVATAFCFPTHFQVGMFLAGHTSLILTAVFLHFRLPNYFEGEHVCHSCGYDMTGNVSGRCPECGTAVQTPMA